MTQYPRIPHTMDPTICRRGAVASTTARRLRNALALLLLLLGTGALADPHRIRGAASAPQRHHRELQKNKKQEAAVVRDTVPEVPEDQAEAPGGVVSEISDVIEFGTIDASDELIEAGDTDGADAETDTIANDAEDAINTLDPNELVESGNTDANNNAPDAESIETENASTQDIVNGIDVNAEGKVLDAVAHLVYYVRVPDGADGTQGELPTYASSITRTTTPIYQSQLVAILDTVAREVVESEDFLGLISSEDPLLLQLQTPTTIDKIQEVGFGSYVPSAMSIRLGLAEQGESCPIGWLKNLSDRCVQVTASAVLWIEQDEVDQEEITSLKKLVQEGFQEALGEAAEGGRLQAALEALYPDAGVAIFTEGDRQVTSAPNSDPEYVFDLDDEEDETVDPVFAIASPEDDGELSEGALVGIAVFGVALVLLVVVFLSVHLQRGRRSAADVLAAISDEDSMPEKGTVDADAIMVTALEWGDAHTEASDIRSIALGGPNGAEAGVETETIDFSPKSSDRSSTQPIYPPMYNLSWDSDDMGSNPKSTQLLSVGRPRHDSAASSDFYLSFRTMESDERVAGPRIILAEGQGDKLLSLPGPAILNSGDISINDGVSLGTASVDALEAAIDTNNWAAVGANAGLLAAQYGDSVRAGHTAISRTSSRDDSALGILPGNLIDDDSTIASQRTTGTTFSQDRRRWRERIDSNKAAELHHLIEQGNWQAIMEAAKRYEQEAEKL